MTRRPIWQPQSLKGILARWLVAVALVPLVLAGIVSFVVARRAMMDEITRGLLSLADQKARYAEEYVSERLGIVSRLARNPILAEAMGEFERALEEGDPASPRYAEVADRYEEYLAFLTGEAGFYDLFLISADGWVAFTVAQEGDLGGSLDAPELRDTQLARAFEAALAGQERPSLTPFSANYQPSGAPAAFAAQPIRVGGEVVGVMAVQIGTATVDDLALDFSGLGETGEVVLAQRVQGDVLFIAPLRHDPEASFQRTVELGSSLAHPIQDAAQGGRGSGRFLDYRGVPVVAAWSHVTGPDWGLVVKIDEEEAFAPVGTLWDAMFILAGLTLLGVLVFASTAAGKLARPILSLKESAVRITGGDLDHRADEDAEFEVGELATSFNRMVHHLKTQIQERETEKEQLDVTLSSIGDGVMSCDVQGRVVFMNHVAEELTGWPEDEARGEPLDDVFRIFDAESGEPLPDPVREVLAGGHTVQLANGTLLRSRDGTEWIIADSAAPIRVAGGEVQGVVLVFRDVTEEERTRAEARRKQATVLAINRVLAEGVGAESSAEVGLAGLRAVEELTGSAFGFIGLVNPEGTFDTVALSDPGWDICRMPESDKTTAIRGMEVRGVWGRVIKEARPLIVEDPGSDPHRVGTPDGHPTLHRFLGAPLWRGDRIVGAVSLANKPIPYTQEDLEQVEEVSRALTEALFRKQAEEALAVANADLEERVQERTSELRRTTEVLERSNADLQQFAYVASHDLQEPLRMVSSFTQLLSERYRGKLDEEADEFIDYAVDGANRMQSLIQGLLRYSRVETRGGTFNEVDLEGVLDGTLRDLSGAIQEKKARIIRGDLPTVTGDGTQLGRVFLNLIHNALTFGRPEGGTIQVEAKRGAEEWIFQIRDDGPGIDPAYHDRIFQMFQRLQSRDASSGTGIGLPICKRIVQRHGGRIWVESEAGSGAAFHFTVPDRSTPND